MGERKSQDLAERLIDGYMQYDYTETWQVSASGIAAALLDADLPRIGQEYAILGISAPVYCYQRVPRRRSDSQAKTVFDVVCSFTNAINRYERTIEGLPASTPEEIAPRLIVELEEYEYESGSILCGITGAWVPHPLSDGISFRQPPPYLQDRIIVAPTEDNLYYGEIVNSANDQIKINISRRYRKKITYWTWHRTWDDEWEGFIDSVNTNDVTMTQYDKDGLRMQLDYGPYELRCTGVIKEDHWRDGRLWFRRGVQMLAKEKATGFWSDTKWFERIVDKGFNEMIWEGQFAGVGTEKLTRNDVEIQLGEDAPYFAKRPIALLQKDPELNQPFWVAPAEPILLNGHGLRAGYSSPDFITSNSSETYNTAYLFYLTYRPKDFTVLDLK